MNKFYHIPPQDLDPFIDAISHGNDEHREWLKESIYNYFFYNHPIQPCRGVNSLIEGWEPEFKRLSRRLTKNELEALKNRLNNYE